MTKNSKCPCGLKQVSFCMAPAMEERVHVLFEARKRTAPPGWEPKLYQVFHDVMTWGIGAFDPATGYLVVADPAAPNAAFYS